MARQTRSSSGDSAPSFIHQNILQDPDKEICTFDSAHLSALKTSGIFPEGTVFRPFDREIRSDMVSDEWICFNAFPFTLGLQFPFPDFITEFFDTTKICFSQTMPMLWRVLLVLDQIKNNHIPDLSVHDLPLAYRLRCHGSCRFLFYSTSSDPLVLRATRNEEEWKSKFFFVKRDSIPGGTEYPVQWLRKADFRKLAPPLADSQKRIDAIRLLPEAERSFNPSPPTPSPLSSVNMSDSSKVPILLDLDKLDSYPTPVMVKKETPAATSSKPLPAPKANPRTRASTAKKRKGSEISAPGSEGFSYDELSFSDSLEPMTSFLNKGLQHLLHLYNDACGTVALHEARIKQLESTVADQGAIAEAKSRHYESLMKKVTQEAELKLATAEMDHEQAMVSFREGIKASAIVSLLQARIKMAYEAKETGLVCPAWPVDSWVAKLKELGGKAVPLPVEAGEFSKSAEVVDQAGDKKDAGADAGEDAGQDAGAEKPGKAGEDAAV
ncbi:hypothetical protein HanIR_Chr01g0015181 [Helianthus annuus]|nr:hypothetical protein HanIR_Chr01g0015181 [Helianthus annuus]